MASYRYERDIQPGDLRPRREKQYTRKERWANWWDYNLKWVILIGIAAAFVAYNFIGQYFFTTKADYNVAVVAPYYLPEDTVNALQTQLAQFGEDRNGDGNIFWLDALVMLLSSAIAAIYSISRNVICSVTSSPYKFIISGSTVFVHVPACAILILFSYPVHRFSIFPHICLVFSDSFPLLFFFHTNPSIHLLGKMIYSL